MPERCWRDSGDDRALLHLGERIDPCGTACDRCDGVTVRDMIEHRPTTRAALLPVSGVGPVKAARYGDAFLKVLRESSAS